MIFQFVTVRVDYYKPSGKWMYEGTFNPKVPLIDMAECGHVPDWHDAIKQLKEQLRQGKAPGLREGIDARDQFVIVARPLDEADYGWPWMLACTGS
jgi:hypothetical protein